MPLIDGMTPRRYTAATLERIVHNIEADLEAVEHQPPPSPSPVALAARAARDAYRAADLAAARVANRAAHIAAYIARDAERAAKRQERRDARTAKRAVRATKRAATNARTIARVAGLIRYSTGVPCRRGHIAERCVSSGQCVVCASDNYKARRAHPDYVPPYYYHPYRGQTEARRKAAQKYGRGKGRLAKRLRTRLSTIMRRLKRNQRAGSFVRDLGCTIPEFRAHIEAQFWLGMTWNNHHSHGWHLDHIIPLASFDLTDREQFLRAAHFTNYQPLWGAHNIAKHDRLDWVPPEPWDIPDRHDVQ